MKLTALLSHEARGEDDAELVLSDITDTEDGLTDDDRNLLRMLRSIRLDDDVRQATDLKPAVQRETYRKMLDKTNAPGSYGRTRRFVLAMTACLLVLMMGAGSLWLLHRNAQNGTDAATGKEMVTVSLRESIARVVLPDSSVVILNTGSTLVYGEDFGRVDRRVCLTGEACFEVRPDSTRAFIVASGGISVRVLGTVFNVSAWPDDREVVTSLIQGSVEVQSGQDGVACRIVPGHAAVYNKKTSRVEVEACDVRNATGWIEGELCFRRKTFPEVCRALERKFGCRIDIRGAIEGDKLFTGRFGSNESLTEILDVIRINHAFRYTVEQNCVTIN